MSMVEVFEVNKNSKIQSITNLYLQQQNLKHLDLPEFVATYLETEKKVAEILNKSES